MSATQEDISLEAAEEGSPAWVVTFADLMSLLLCFFVLLLSFSEMDRQKYKEVAGALANAFGVQRKTPVFESPKAQNIIARAFDRELQIATRDKEEIGREVKKEVENRFQDIKDLIQVEVRDGKVTIRLMGETTFDSGSAQIKSKLMPLLQKIGTILSGAKGDVTIAGHTDNVPVDGLRYRSNLELSAARAVSVAEYFISQTRMEPKRISTMGYGKYRPIESNDTPQGRKKNRRVEIILSSAP